MDKKTRSYYSGLRVWGEGCMEGMKEYTNLDRNYYSGFTGCRVEGGQRCIL